MKKYLLLPFIFVSLVAWAQQNVAFEKKNFKDDVKGFKQAVDSLDAGEKVFQLGQTHYYMAIRYYLGAEKFNPNNDQLNYKIGECMLSHNSPFKTEALPYLQKAFALNPAVAPDIHFLLGRAYHLNMDWENAKKEYSSYLQTLNQKKDGDAIAATKKKIDECTNGELLVKSPVRVFIDNVSPSINTEYPEYGAIISADESEMIFTSKRPTTTGGKLDPDDGQYLEDLYISFNKNGNWSPATNMGSPINTDGDDATSGISVDGQTLYVYRDGDIFETHLKGITWTKPERMNNKINTQFKETSVSLSPDGKTLYFVSDRPGGYGDRDIYKSVADAKGRWTEAVNLGAVINTQYGEEGISMQADGKTLYFSSQGHNSMGGYDIFKSVYENGSWSNPENLGYPINTPDDDIFFSISASGKHGYYTSIRKEGKGEKDIYMVTFLGPEKPVVQSNEDDLLAGNTSQVSDVMMTAPVVVNTPKVTLLKGIITDSMTHKPIEASIELVDNKKNIVIASFLSNSSTGKYLVSLPAGINYGIAVKAEGFLFYSANFDLPDTSKFTTVEKNVALQPLDIGSRIVLRNIFFDFNKATLRDESTAELDRLINLLTTYSKLKIEISGYTDNKGSADYNQKLSESRAKSVVDYLVAHGIASDRLTFKGYGKDDPIATNETDDGRQQNRRTEFKITGK
ncbi:MAG TPA: OmpA family protein [Bacteroidia bacterium]|jgi:outer membrane protein OmpA-like peptidoglycan-associated protein|nr:OmpA family protein [Bacteroidia bacterium]